MKNISEIERLIARKDIKSTLDALSRVEGALYYATDTKKYYYDNGIKLIQVMSGDRPITVGSLSQVQNGTADYDSITTAIINAIDGDMIIVKSGSYIENITINKNIHIIGEGHGTVIQGNLSFNSTRNGCSIIGLKVTGQISFVAGSKNCIMNDCWVSITGSVLDNGTNNIYSVLQEA